MTHDPTTDFGKSAHLALIDDQFTRQAAGFAAAPELHNDAILDLLIQAGAPQPSDTVIDIACGTGSVVAAFAPHVTKAIGLDATAAMLAEAHKLAADKALHNVQWHNGSAYDVPYPSATFNIVTCRFAFHHMESPRDVLAEMVRVAAPGARIVLCDAVASEIPEKAAAFNHMERWRDPSTIEFRTRAYLEDLYTKAGLGVPTIAHFQVPYLAHEFVASAFPANEDRAGLLRLIEDSVHTDALGMKARRDADGVHIAFQAVVLSAIKRL